MMWFVACAALLAGVDTEPAKTPPAATVIVAVGEPGEAQYGEMFVEWAGRWREAASQANCDFREIGLAPQTADAPADRDLLRNMLSELEKDPPPALWIVLIGHGTFDGKKAKFNLRGADITATELAERLESLSCRIAVINCASASGPFVEKLSGENRAVLAATKSGFEHNFARFGGYLSQAIGNASGDLDKDGQTSLLEAWLAAAKQTQEYYDADSRLATEHSLLDDNGDAKGTPADWFRGIHVVKRAKDGALPDGTLANQFILVPAAAEAALPEEQRRQRDDLERQLAELRQRRGEQTEAEYLDALEKIVLPLAELYQAADPPADGK